MNYNAIVEIDRSGNPTDEQLEKWMPQLDAFAGTVGVNEHGKQYVHLIVHGDSIAQASLAATAVAEHITAASVSGLTIVPQEVFEQREGFAPVPELIGTKDAAAILGVTPQRVNQMIDAGKLGAIRIGQRGVALQRKQVEQVAGYSASLGETYSAQLPSGAAPRTGAPEE